MLHAGPVAQSTPWATGLQAPGLPSVPVRESSLSPSPATFGFSYWSRCWLGGWAQQEVEMYPAEVAPWLS